MAAYTVQLSPNVEKVTGISIGMPEGCAMVMGEQENECGKCGMVNGTV